MTTEEKLAIIKEILECEDANINANTQLKDIEESFVDVKLSVLSKLHLHFISFFSSIKLDNVQSLGHFDNSFIFSFKYVSVDLID